MDEITDVVTVTDTVEVVADAERPGRGGAAGRGDLDRRHVRRLLIAALDRRCSTPRCELHPQVALRPEPFGALAYHYGNRRLVFLKHPDVVARRAARSATTDSSPTTLAACGIAEPRWPSFAKALDSLQSPTRRCVA